MQAELQAPLRELPPVGEDGEELQQGSGHGGRRAIADKEANGLFLQEDL